MTINILESHTVDQNTGCWLWLRGVNSDGYPCVKIKQKSHRVHRLIWEIFRGPIPLDKQVCHRCDVRSCINPDHLFLGTPKDNYDDMVSKGRKAKFDYAFAKLSLDDAESVKAYIKEGHSHGETAKRFGISRTYVSLIVSGHRRRGDR